MEQITIWKVFLSTTGSIITAVVANYLIQFTKNTLEHKTTLLTALEMYRGMLIANSQVIKTIAYSDSSESSYASINGYNEFDTIFSKINIEILFRHYPDIATNILYMKILASTLKPIETNLISKDQYDEFLVTSTAAIEMYTALINQVRSISTIQWIFMEIRR